MDLCNQGAGGTGTSLWPRKASKDRKACPSAEEQEFLFQAINRWGETISCELMFTFEAEGKNYLVYTDNTYTLLGRLNLYATRYNPETFGKGKPIFLRDPESEPEWRRIYRVACELMDGI